MTEDYDDEQQVAAIVQECLHVMRKHTYHTITKMTSCYNLTARILRLFCVQGEKKDVIDLIDNFYDALKKEIEEFYDK